MTFGLLKARLLLLKWYFLSAFGTKMGTEQRANIRFWFNLVKRLPKGFNWCNRIVLMFYSWCDLVYECYTRFKKLLMTSSTTLMSDSPSWWLRQRASKTAWCFQHSFQIVVAFYGNEIGHSPSFTYKTLMKHLGHEKLCAHSVPTSLLPTKSCSECNIVKTSTKSRKRTTSSFTTSSLLLNVVFLSDLDTKRRNAKWRPPKELQTKIFRFHKSKVNSMLICVYYQKGPVHHDLYPLVQTVTL